MTDNLYRRIAMPSDEPVNFVGVHPLKWSRHPQDPDVGFIEAEDEEPTPAQGHTGVLWLASGTERKLPSDAKVQFETGGGDTLEVSFSNSGGLTIHSLTGNPLSIQIVTSNCIEIDT